MKVLIQLVWASTLEIIFCAFLATLTALSSALAWLNLTKLDGRKLLCEGTYTPQGGLVP